MEKNITAIIVKDRFNLNTNNDVIELDIDLELSGELNVENIDVFVEKGVFEIEDSRKR